MRKEMNFFDVFKRLGQRDDGARTKQLQASFNDTDTPINESKRFITLVNCLYTIANGDFSADVSFKVNSLLHNWCQFKNIFIAFVFMDIFKLSTPVSKYLS